MRADFPPVHDTGVFPSATTRHPFLYAKETEAPCIRGFAATALAVRNLTEYHKKPGGIRTKKTSGLPPQAAETAL